MCVLPAHIQVPDVGAMPSEASRGCQIPWKLYCRWLRGDILVLGTKSRSSVKAAIFFNSSLCHFLNTQIKI